MSSHTQPPCTAVHARETLINWLALLVLLALGVSCSPADAGSIPDERAGSLLLKSSADAVPLEALRQLTRMHATVTGNVARVEVTQTFTNQSSDWMEGMYVFPLPADSAVDELRMQIGERTIVGQIRERAAARAAYEAARSEGRQASLVDQQRPNMFATSVANIPPAGTITVTIAYLDSIAYRDGRYTLSLPLSITPRYTPGAGSDADGAVIPAAAMSPEQVSGATQNVAIEVDLEPGFALGAVQSLYHAVTETAGANGRRISFSASEAPADRDFELTWKPQLAPETQAAAFSERDGNDAFVLLMLTPPQMTSRQAGAREVIFIIDTSGSMQGPSIEQARAALRLGVARLRPGDRFNVIRFSDAATRLFQKPEDASAANIAAAGRFIDALSASGGTEMRPALQLAFATQPGADALRQIIFITDGSVGNEGELVRLIHDRIGAGRLFTVGIGAAPNAYFMHAAAAAGRGSYTFIGSRDQVQERMSDLFRKLEQPALTDLQLQFPGGAAAELAAPLPGDLYAGDPLVIAARVASLPQGLLTLSGSSEGHAWVRQVPLTGVTGQSGVGKLWARQRIAELSAQRSYGPDAPAAERAILELALAHHLVSDFTSLIAVDVTPLRPQEAPYEHVQAPTAAPQGSYWANSTGFARTATPAPLLLLIGVFALALAAVVGTASVRPGGRRPGPSA